MQGSGEHPQAPPPAICEVLVWGWGLRRRQRDAASLSQFRLCCVTASGWYWAATLSFFQHEIPGDIPFPGDPCFSSLIAKRGASLCRLTSLPRTLLRHYQWAPLPKRCSPPCLLVMWLPHWQTAHQRRVCEDSSPVARFSEQVLSHMVSS